MGDMRELVELTSEQARAVNGGRIDWGDIWDTVKTYARAIAAPYIFIN